MTGKILVIDDSKTITMIFKRLLSKNGYEVTTTNKYKDAIKKLDEVEFDLIFSDIFLDTNSGIDLLREIKERNLPSPVVLITGFPGVETASEAVRLGAFDYIVKPVKNEVILHLAQKAIDHKKTVYENREYQSNLEAIFRSVKDAIIAVDGELRIIAVNDAAGNICRFSGEDLKGKKFNEIPKVCEARCLEAIIKTIKEKKPVETTHFECKYSDNTKETVTLTTFPLQQNQNELSGCIAIVKTENRLSFPVKGPSSRQQFYNIVGKSEKMQQIYSLIDVLADVQSSVLITGATGTGKELAAEALHYRGKRKNKPLVKVNCASLTENLISSELFGHIKGAFTGAVDDKIGRFQMADGGTIFLDEIGDISISMQLRLLRVLQEMEFERVGESTSIKVDVRVVAATNQDLKQRVKEGLFREDLYHRLKVVELQLPMLSEKQEDMPLLVNHFINKFNNKFNKHVVAVSDDVLNIFKQYPWPGNIRELEHILEHAFILCNGETITVDGLPSDLGKFIKTKTGSSFVDLNNEPQNIVEALRKTGGNKAKAARLLGVDRKTVYTKIKKYNIVTENAEA